MTLNEAQAAFVPVARSSKGTADDAETAALRSRRRVHTLRPARLLAPACLGAIGLLTCLLSGSDTSLGLASFGLLVGGVATALAVWTEQAGSTAGEPGIAPGHSMVAAFTGDIVTLHEASGDVLFANGAVQAILGADDRQLRGAGLFGHVHIADRPLFLTILARALDGTAGTAELRMRRQSPAGEVAFIWTKMRASPWDERQAVCCFADIGSRRQIEEDLETLRAASPDRKLNRLLARAANELALQIQAAHRSLELGAVDGVAFRQTRADGLAVLERCRSDAARLQAVLEHSADAKDRQKTAITIDAVVESCCAEVLAASGLQRAAVAWSPGLASAVWPSDISVAVLQLLLCEAFSKADAGEAVRLSAVREGGEYVLRISFKTAAGSNGASPDGEIRDLWRAVAEHLIEPLGGGIRHEARAEGERLILRLPATGAIDMRVVELGARSKTSGQRQLVRAAG